MSARLWPLAAALTALTLSATARADLPPPEANVVCEGKKIGEACEIDGQAGACVEDQCSRNDYTNGPPPTTVTYACPRCAAGEKPSATPTPVEPEPEPEPIATPEPVAGPEPTADDSLVKATDSANKGGCAVAPATTGGSLLLFALLGLARRRRS
ncbi:MAG: MYXO-CTERM sorting domain-containing protein [Nannocystaceae bacterium]